MVKVTTSGGWLWFPVALFPERVLVLRQYSVFRISSSKVGSWTDLMHEKRCRYIYVDSNGANGYKRNGKGNIFQVANYAQERA
ncbi:unnamed protein product [Coffea canephora]|uniref:Uncharacterized protein n=1 Tax=Coffea canephora TaxID=49390 RepID=A0A068V068_COFCA|nr:unnamed protein product [Coffea canephora]